MRAAALLALLLVGSIGCSSGSNNGTNNNPPPDVFRIPVTIETETGDHRFMAEVADDGEERMKGLMFRTEMDDDHGMLFLFPRERQQSFWMKNTLIPLDMIFIKADRSILGIVENAEPETTIGRSVPGLSQFVLEINGGLSRELGIEAGQTVRFTAPIPER